MSSVCWWCVHPPEDGTFLHLPHKYDHVKNQFETMGQFCSWSCMKAHCIEHMKAQNNILGNITIYRKRLEGKIRRTRVAPSRFALKMFGGPLSIEEFRECCDGKTEIYVEMPNEIRRHLMVHTANISRYTGAPMAQGDSLRLKRNKPLKKEQTGLQVKIRKRVKTFCPGSPH